jgi:hypothetical protein
MVIIHLNNAYVYEPAGIATMILYLRRTLVHLLFS